MLQINGETGFSMKFENGWTVSVQFGTMHYCSNKHMVRVKEQSCANAEIAAWDGKDNWYEFDGDPYKTVNGWCDADQVADFITMIKNKDQDNVNQNRNSD